MSVFENFKVYKMNKEQEEKQKEIIEIERANRFKLLLEGNKEFYLFSIDCKNERKRGYYVSFTFEEEDISNKTDLFEVYEDDYNAFLSRLCGSSDSFKVLFDNRDYHVQVIKYKVYNAKN